MNCFRTYKFKKVKIFLQEFWWIIIPIVLLTVGIFIKRFFLIASACTLVTFIIWAVLYYMITLLKNSIKSIKSDITNIIGEGAALGVPKFLIIPWLKEILECKNLLVRFLLLFGAVIIAIKIILNKVPSPASLQWVILTISFFIGIIVFIPILKGKPWKGEVLSGIVFLGIDVLELLQGMSDLYKHYPEFKILASIGIFTGVLGVFSAIILVVLCYQGTRKHQHCIFAVTFALMLVTILMYVLGRYVGIPFFLEKSR